MNLHSGHNKVVSLQQALDASRSLAKHNPFVRMTGDEQKIANQASAVLKKAANKAATPPDGLRPAELSSPLVPLCTEELQDLMRGIPKWQTEWNNEKYKSLF